MHTINNQLNSIYIGLGITTNLGFAIFDNKKYDKIFVLTHDVIKKKYNNHKIFNNNYEIIKIKENENSKNINTIQEIIDKLLAKKCSRKSLIIGFGGGVITDIAGFVASIFMRGINHILIPTTLLGMVDASIGGKTGINTSKGKNIIGTFKQPKAIYVDLFFLNTLNKKQIINGFAEIIKYG